MKTDAELRELDAWLHLNVCDGAAFVGLRKRGYWYRENAHGYTDRQSEAGKYTREQAKAHEYLRGDEPVTIHEFDIPHYTTNPADAFEVLKRCAEKCEQMPRIDPIAGRWIWRNLDPHKLEWSEAETLELAISEYARQLFTKENR